MNEIGAKLTVFFDEPFWVGVFERMEDGNLSVCKVTFGAEPKDYEILEYILRHYFELKFSYAVKTELKCSADNPKRRQRTIQKAVQPNGIGTKSQQALAAQREETKLEHRKRSREERDAENRRRFDLKQQKRKEKHRGH